MRKQLGFTLIEIAIVLVIIGLLLGGVLKGQELITSTIAISIRVNPACLRMIQFLQLSPWRQITQVLCQKMHG